jgi:hydroxyacylglutathione hydrolase
VRVISIDIPELGNRSYLVYDGSSTIVFDPSRRTQQIIDAAKKHSLSIAAVFETHIHNDYVTGGYALASKLGIPYYVSANEKADFKHEKIIPNQTVKVGTLNVTALASPGHTPHHLSYLVEQVDATAMLFSGGSLLYGSVGRPDLISAGATPTLAKAQYQTAQFFAERLAPSTILYPTHGFGSFCAATETEHIAVSTLKQQMKSNQAYTAKDEASFVDNLLSKLDDHPSYYAYMAPANLEGPSQYQLGKPSILTKEAVQRAMHSGAAIIDLRSRRAYAAEHMPGSYNIELSSDLATYVGWLLAWAAPLILVAPTAKEVSVAQEQLSLIGRELITGQMRPSELPRTASYPVRNFSDLAKVVAQSNVLLLDVRRHSEWQKGHIPGAKHIPLHMLRDRLSEIADDKEIWVHCASGFRASIAASIMSGYGKSVVLLDDNFVNVVKSGLMPVKKQKFVGDIASGRAQLLDVRDESDWEVEHAKNAIHIPLGRLLDGDTKPLDEDSIVYVYCSLGERSDVAADYLNGQGFNTINVGGLSDWIQAGGKIEH